MWSIDLFATALDAAGLPLPKDKPLDGKSILPVLKGESNKLHDKLYWSSGGGKGKWAIRSGKWKLVAERNRELFDLEKDLSEDRPCEKASKSSFRTHRKLQSLARGNGRPHKQSEKRWKPGDAASANNKSKEKKKAARVKAREAKKKSPKP